MNQSIKLQTSAILHVPFNKYVKDFTFIVNGQCFQTNKIVADLLSSKISSYHLIDPTISEFVINTSIKGDFQQFLKLQEFNEEELSIDDFLFIREIINELGTEKVELKENREEISIDNVIGFIEKDEKFRHIYLNEYENEVKFISMHFSEIISTQRSSFLNLSVYTIERILTDSSLKLENENELLKIINEFYQRSNKYSILYEYVYFCNVSIDTLEEFINIFDINDLNVSAWHSICECLKAGVKTENKKNKRYKNDKFQYNSNVDFNGIFNFLRTNSNLNEEVKITASSVERGNLNNIIQFGNLSHEFHTKNEAQSWVCFEFIKRRVIPSNYTIRSNCWGFNYENPKSWVFEGSNDSQNWEILDSQINCEFLNGQCLVHTFSIQDDNNHSFKYFRIRQTGSNCGNSNYLCFNCFELYGKFASDF